MCDIKKEFNQLDKNGPTIGLVMMLKNEEKRLHVSLESVVGHVDALIIYDTGSTDNTINIVEEFCEKNKINLYLKKGVFEDFSTSRNVSLDLADSVDVHYLLLLDCNDELKDGNKLRLRAKEFLDKENNGFLVCQEWWSGHYDKYYNVRFVKNRCGWRYRGSVHEWVKDTFSENDQPRFHVVRLNDIVLYQDRTKDDDKSAKRFTRDRELLLKDHKKNPTEPRTLFYLAQTCQCLGLQDEAMYYSKLRLKEIGFVEERFHSYMRCGNIACVLGHEWEDCLKWYLKAYEEFPRAEPLIKIAEYYKDKASYLANKGGHTFNLWKNAFLYINEACQLHYPDECILFVDKLAYDYKRWNLMGIIGYYAGKYQEGKVGCLKAIETGIEKELNEKNLKFYIDKEKELSNNNEGIVDVSKLTKTQFVNGCMVSLQKQFPKFTQSQLQKKAISMWKNRNKK
jgi:glycosyltransferase involved in cell wall biosynthesis